MRRRFPLLRDSDGDEALELLLVFAVVTVLGVRGILRLAGYPHLGGSALHIAHMLWGGMFMLAAITLLLVFWNPPVRRLAAIVGGVGFGLFIDELGKFVTRDNDYFFRPTVAALYLLFLGLFLAVRWLRVARPLSRAELRANSDLRELLTSPEEGAGRLTRLYFDTQRALALSYEFMVQQPWFRIALTAWFVGLAVFNLGYAAFLVGSKVRGSIDVPALRLLSAVAGGLCVWVGAIALPRSRLAAYVWFQRGVLLTLLFTQVLHFYRSQFGALGGLAVNLLLYLALGFLINRERRLRAARRKR